MSFVKGCTLFKIISWAGLLDHLAGSTGRSSSEVAASSLLAGLADLLNVRSRFSLGSIFFRSSVAFRIGRKGSTIDDLPISIFFGFVRMDRYV